MSLSLLEIKKIASLSGIELSDRQLIQAQHRFSRFIFLVDQMRLVDTKNIQPLEHPVALKGLHDVYLRDDTEEDVVDLYTAEKNAPRFNETLFQVPKIIE